MPEYKLYYFPVHNRAELIRYLFNYKQIPFEDKQVTFEDWPSLKPKTPLGQMPMLEIDGKTKLCQSHSIERYLAKVFGLAGKTKLEAAKCDMYVDGIEDLYQPYSKVYKCIMNNDDEGKEKAWAEFRDDNLKPFYQRYDKIIENNKKGHLVGKDTTWADIALAEHAKRMDWIFEPGCLDEFTNVKKLVDMVHSEPGLKAYVERRKKLSF